MNILTTAFLVCFCFTIVESACSGYCNAPCSCAGDKLSFQCKDGITCIDLAKYRDSQCDCPDCSDEDCCDWHYKCDQWRGTWKCVSQKLVDNGVPDCTDLSDESDIVEQNCTALEKLGPVHSCNTQKNGPKIGKCVPISKLMDGHPDCPLGDDEDGNELDLCYMRKSTCNLKHTTCVKDSNSKRGYRCACINEKLELKSDGTCA